MEAFEIADLVAERERIGRLYLEFLRVPALSVGLYVLPADGTDPQEPHTEDEVYYIVSGRGAITVEGEDREVQAGSVVYVKAGDGHKFHSIKEELRIIVFFAPSEYSLAQT